MAAGDLKDGVTLAKGIFAMDSRASGRLALTIAAAFFLAALTTTSLQACESCAPSDAAQAGKAANALPTYPETTTEQVAAPPVALKKFTRAQSRSARRAQPRKASLVQRANAGKYAARKAEKDEADASGRAKPAAKVAPAVANAKAELVETETRTVAAEASLPAPPVVLETTTADALQPPAVQLVAAEEFNELDRAAWESNQMPRLMKLSTSDSHAELREDDSKWAQTSTIGKLFVAFGALLTLGSAIRMFMA
jgi:hypothetical protein